MQVLPRIHAGARRKYRFIAEGGSLYYSDFLRKLSPGDRVFAYKKQAGYVGFGIVSNPSVPVRDFIVGETPILNLPLKVRGSRHDLDDLDKCEYLVGMEWIKTFPLSEAKTFAGDIRKPEHRVQAEGHRNY